MASLTRALRDPATWLLFLIFCSVGIRFWAVGSIPGINGDELHIGVKVLMTLRQEPISLATGSNLPAEPLSFAVMTLIHVLFSPSFFLLRMTPVITGLMTLWVAWFVGKELDRGGSSSLGALLLTSLVACHPVSLTYARFAWEPSQSMLAVLLVIGVARTGNIIATIVMVLFSLWVHPTNIFAVPVAWYVLAGRLRERWEDNFDVLPRWKKNLAIVNRWQLSLKFMCVIAVVTTVIAIYNEGFNGYRLFINRVVRLMDGSTVLLYILGFAPKWVHVVGWICSIVALVMLGWGLLRKTIPNQVIVLILSLVISANIFVVKATHRVALKPNVERYGLWMLTAFLFLICMSMMHSFAKRRIQTLIIANVLCLFWLTVFSVGYMRQMMLHNSRSEQTFMTGPVEPKAEASRVLEDFDLDVVYTDSWWTYWAIKYLAMRGKNGKQDAYEVTILGQRWDKRFPEDYKQPPPHKVRSKAWVGFGHPPPRYFKLHKVIKGYGDQVVLRVGIGL